MNAKVVLVTVGLACALLAGSLALAVRTAHAQSGTDTIVFTVQNLGFADCGGSALFGLSFDMVSPAGALLGTGTSCVTAVEGCQFAAGCRDTTSATFVLDFAAGSVTASMTLFEFWVKDVFVIQHGRGTVQGGTGAFSGTSGSVTGDGWVDFSDNGLATQLTYRVSL